MSPVNIVGASSSSTNRESYEGLDEWHESLLEAVRGLGGRAEDLYRPGRQLDHYRRLAITLWERFGDGALATAGFLHGIPFRKLRGIESRVGKEVLGILEGWEILVELDPEEPGFAADLQEATLNHVIDPRVAVLFVFERLDRFDPYGILADWTLRFRLDPQKFPQFEELTPDDLQQSGRTPYKEPAVFVEEAVAPAAEYWGMWFERNVLRNAGLRHRNPQRFDQVIDFVLNESDWAESRVQRVSNSIQKAEPELWSELSFRWEWRHLASISERFGSIDSASWSEERYAVGFVSVICPDHATCYRLLGILHSQFDYRYDFFRDSIGSPTRSEYRGLHTGLVDPDSDDKDPSYLSVRMIPKSNDEIRWRPVGRDHLRRFKENISHWQQDEIRVFAPGRRPIFLPLGATVLNFIAETDPDHLSIYNGAIIGQKVEVGLFHTLKPGTVIELIEAEEVPVSLPEGWARSVPEQTVKEIEAIIGRNYKRELEMEGRERIQGELGSLKVDTELIDIFLESAIADLRKTTGVPQHDISWWYQQIALDRYRDDQVNNRHELKLDPEDIQNLLELTRKQIARLNLYETSLNIDPRERKVDAVEICDECNPDRRSRLAMSYKRSTVTIHREGSSCAEGAERIIRKHLSLGQFFILEMENRRGVVRDTLDVFADRKIHMVENVVRLLGTDWVLMRLEVEPIGIEAMISCTKILESIPGVVRVFPPSVDLPFFFKTFMPPRFDSRSFLSAPPPPFICGPVIREPHYFYGRQQELEILFGAARRLSSWGGEGSQMFFIAGPLKSGKTSLAQRFLQSLRGNQEAPFLTVYHKPAVDDTWHEVESALNAKLKRSARDAPVRWALGAADIPSDDLRKTIRELYRAKKDKKRYRPTVVLAIDEAPRLFRHTGENEDSKRGLLYFRSFLNGTQGVLVIWIGPDAVLDELDPELHHVLDQSALLRVKPLDLEATRGMVQAKKLEPFHQISASQKSIERIHRLTGGDPFWISHLADGLWRLGKGDQSNSFKVEPKHIRQASADLVVSSTPFKGRIFPEGLEAASERDRLEILMALDELLKSGESVELHRLYKHLRQDNRWQELVETVLLEHLKVLAARGALVSNVDHWAFSAQLVRDYIRYEQRKV